MIAIVIGAIVFIGFFIYGLIDNAADERKRRKEEEFRKRIRDKYPNCYQEYLEYNKGRGLGVWRPKYPELMGWSEQKWIETETKLKERNRRRERIEKDKRWAKEQRIFANQCVEIAKKTMPTFGYYSYKPKISTITEKGETSSLDMLVWQHFPCSLCLNPELDYTNVQYIKTNLERFLQFKNKTTLSSQYYVSIIDFISELQKDEEVFVYFNYSIDGWEKETLTYHYESLIDFVDGNVYANPDATEKTGDDYKQWEDRLMRKIVIIDMMTENDQLKQNCARIFENLRDRQPLIAYISLLKCYDDDEMQKIITEANEEAERKAEEERRQEEERRRKEQEERERREKLARLERNAPNVFSANTQEWEGQIGNLSYTWLFYYYPTTCEFEANEKEWDNRWCVWNFKNDPEKGTSVADHQEALNDVIPQIKERLIDTFGEEYLQFLTLVCLPASTRRKNQARYEEFSNQLCEETGMLNGYPHTHITKDGLSKKDPANTTGRSIQPEVSFDDWFAGKYVLLFDDVITRGTTMLRYKGIMERTGATVVGGFTLGKTKHERPVVTSNSARGLYRKDYDENWLPF